MEKVNYVEVNYGDIKKHNKLDTLDLVKFTNYLFHGCRRGMIDESLNKLTDFSTKADIFISYLKDNINNILDKKGIDPEGKIRGLERVYVHKKIKNFEYGDFYLTSSYLTAIRFSKNGAGELGELAYLCAIDIKKLGIEFEDKNINEISDYIINKYNQYSKTEKVILAVDNVSFDDLRYEKGNEIDDYYKKFLYKNNKVSLTRESIFNFRLKNLGKYKFYLIKEDDFLKFIPLFTNIKEDEMESYKKKNHID